MKIIEKYVANDGTEFRNGKDALHRDELLNSISSIEKLLPTRPDDANFANGHGYIQHKYETIEKVKGFLYELCLIESPSLSEYNFDSYGFVRSLDDSSSPLYKLYYRIVMCVDDQLREYGQPYFANHPDKAEQRQLN